MIPRSFEYLAPHTLDEAISLLQKTGPEPKILSGGLGVGPSKHFDILGLKMFDSAEIRIHPTGKAIARCGNILQGSFMNYLLPTAVETPNWETDKIRNLGINQYSPLHSRNAAYYPLNGRVRQQNRRTQ
jgi:hypothetical protein